MLPIAAKKQPHALVPTSTGHTRTVNDLDAFPISVQASIHRLVKANLPDVPIEEGSEALLQVAYLLFLKKTVKEAREIAQSQSSRTINREHVRQALEAVEQDIRLV